MGAMRERLPDVLRTPSGKIELAPPEIVADVPRLEQELAAVNTAARSTEGALNGQMVLIGRRQLRSNNSWMHNLPALVKGKDRCTVQVHPDDAERLGLADGGSARVSSSSGELVVPVEVTDEIMRGVVSIPHGWGHDAAGNRMAVAAEHAGVNSNLLAPVDVDARQRQRGPQRDPGRGHRRRPRARAGLTRHGPAPVRRSDIATDRGGLLIARRAAPSRPGSRGGRRATWEQGPRRRLRPGLLRRRDPRGGWPRGLGRRRRRQRGHARARSEP